MADLVDILDNNLNFENAKIALIGPGSDLDDHSVFYYLNRIYGKNSKLLIIDRKDCNPCTCGLGYFGRFQNLLNSFLEKTNLDLSKNLEYASADAEILHNIIEEESFDIISFRNVFSYLNDSETSNSFKSAYKVLKNGGKLVVFARQNNSNYDLIKSWFNFLHDSKAYPIKEDYYKIKFEKEPIIPQFDSVFNDYSTPEYKKIDHAIIFKPKFSTDRLLIGIK